MMPASQALILDFGGVISRTLFETHDLTEAALGLPKGSLTWRGPFAPETDALWRAMQNDEISERDYWAQRTREVGRLIGKDWTKMTDFVVAARGADPEAVIRPEALHAIETAKRAGVTLAILSNELDLFYGASFRERLPFLKDFEVIVDATYSGILKPDARAYQECLNQLDLPPQACVFVDDQLRNIHGGLTAGLNCVHFDVKNPSQGYARALSLLGLEQGIPS
jgi:putative hydrolase of the HAD superfamily